MGAIKDRRMAGRSLRRKRGRMWNVWGVVGVGMACALAFGFVFSAAAAEKQKLSMLEITMLLSGAKVSVVTEGKDNYEVTHYLDGTQSLVRVGTDYEDTGVWTAACQGYCSRWEKTDNGIMECFDVFEKGDGSYRFEGEAKTLTVRILNVDLARRSLPKKDSLVAACCGE